MENFNRGHYESIKKALKRVGFKVDEIAKQGKKTVITVFRCETRENVTTSSEKKKNNESKNI